MSDQPPPDIVPEQRRPEQAPAAQEQEEDNDDIVGVFPPDFPIPIEPVLPVYEMRQKFDTILRHLNDIQRTQNEQWAMSKANKKRAAEIDKEDVASKKHIKETLDEILERVGKIEHMVMEGASPDQPSTSRVPPKKLCIFCDGEHYASACPNYTTLSARSARAEQRKKCIRCLFDKDHLATACRTKSVCYYCKRDGRAEFDRHHTAFCHYQFKM